MTDGVEEGADAADKSVIHATLEVQLLRSSMIQLTRLRENQLCRNALLPCARPRHDRRLVVALIARDLFLDGRRFDELVVDFGISRNFWRGGSSR
jgi:hypothetical protein